MAACKVITLLICAVIVIVFSPVEAQNENTTSICGPGKLGQLEGCCSYIPRILTNTSFVNCLQEMAKTNKSTETRRLSVQSKKRRSKRDKKSKSDEKKSGIAPMCLMECVLRNQSLLQSNGQPDMTAIKKQFLAISNSSWEAIINKAADNCTNEYNNFINKEQNNRKNNTECSVDSVLVMTCMRRYLALSCPNEFINKQDKTCPTKLKALQGCNPFTLKKDADSKSTGEGKKKKKAERKLAKGQQKAHNKEQKKAEKNMKKQSAKSNSAKDNKMGKEQQAKKRGSGK